MAIAIHVVQRQIEEIADMLTDPLFEIEETEILENLHDVADTLEEVRNRLQRVLDDY